MKMGGRRQLMLRDRSRFGEESLEEGLEEMECGEIGLG